MSAIVDFVLSSPGMVAAMCVAALWLWRRPGSIAARRVLGAAAVCYLLASIYAVPATINSVLAYGYRQFDTRDAPAGPTAVIVLGAGAETVMGWEHRPVSALNGAGIARVVEAARVFRLIHPAWLVASGGVVDERLRVEPDSLLMRDALVRLGVPESSILLESISGDTREEAIQVKLLLTSQRIERVVLVTSDTHMRRSVGAFRAQGISVTPAIAPEPRRFGPWRVWLTPTASGLSLSGEVAHELAGIPYYWARGWWRATAP
jgi:uncharacterized SAM-binding protein YcdF (DUF218 family)